MLPEKVYATFYLRGKSNEYKIQTRQINRTDSTVLQTATTRTTTAKRDNHDKVGNNNGKNSDSKDCCFNAMDLTGQNVSNR